MHPALSVILFTVSSAAGYGLLVLIGILGPAGVLPPHRGFGIAAFVLGFLLVGFGAIASAFHLGRPERAWRAFTQWRSSWLSREAVFSVASLVPALILAAGWVLVGRADGPWAIAGAATAVLSLVTLYSTAMIYASLKPIPQWHNAWVPTNTLLLAFMSGALWLNALATTAGIGTNPLAWLALLAGLMALAGKLAYWRFIDGAIEGPTAESATGLGRFGKVRMFEAPHTQDNYLLREMGFRIARKHAGRLRTIALGAGFVIPLILTAAMLVLRAAAPAWLASGVALAAAVLAMAGLIVERWLFFAEARHAVTLYYGASSLRS